MTRVRKYYEAIAVSRLKVDESLDAQRMFQKQWATKLEEIWDPFCLMVATVSRRPNGFYLIDGQHSTAVALKVEGEGFLRDCMVYENLSPELEAKLFLAANRDRKPVRPFDNFRVALTAKEPEALRIQVELRSVDLELANSNSTNRVGAVETIRALAPKAEMIARVLSVCEAAWGRKGETWDSMMMRALGEVLTGANWIIADDKRLIKTLQKLPVPIWKSQAYRSTKGGGGSKSRSTPLAVDIIGEYNKRLGRDKMLFVP